MQFKVKLCPLSYHVCTALASLPILVGCGSEAAGPATVAVTGTVTMNGLAIADADLSFLPVSDDPSATPAQAITDSEGRFEVVSVFDQGKTTKPGMVPGEYHVEIRLLQSAPAGTGPMQRPTNTLPEKYASAETSGFKVTVGEGNNNFPFEITR